MKLFSAAQIRQWDQYTIQNEPIAPIALMERAAMRCCNWIDLTMPAPQKYTVFCGPGNNGGDGLAIARLLILKKNTVQVFILGGAGKNSADFLTNLERLQALTSRIELLEKETDFPVISSADIIIDALFGNGLNRSLSSLQAALVDHINRCGNPVIAIDMPSGLFADKSSKDNVIVNATHTLTLQVMKPAFLLPENAAYTGNVHVIDIGLHRQYYNDTAAGFEIVEQGTIHSFIHPRKKFSHKGTYGNAALVAGSHGMMGAAVLGAKACMRSGAGKLTCYIPNCGYTILQSTVPEAMCVTDINENHHTSLMLRTEYDAYAIGPGMGQHNTGAAVLEALLDKKPRRLVIDADGLNLLSADQRLYLKIPAHAILTPHPKEFERLFGTAKNDFERLELALQKAKALQVYIVIKGNYSFIATPGGKGYFNPTGNPGMATAGSGDALTGILLGLIAQYNNAEQAVLTGVYLHGLAGDIAAKQQTEEAMTAGDIIECIPAAFARIKTGVYFT
ncbi:NAD(P)H-hydrate dehydratase [Agriterribacter sp.]|uniref:NAD(P)H-hydrate dehydratase n=1 Tax=Agriterribacter sp. TaxID=2821509 RepID=UPI002BE11656|nr:NAD(P)H-hydrate dehydratase [Agriterribacter sp.]HRP57916.1 NAD(P)H-hydrate dehydratase [Agriterribacter sp.]